MRRRTPSFRPRLFPTEVSPEIVIVPTPTASARQPRKLAPLLRPPLRTGFSIQQTVSLQRLNSAKAPPRDRRRAHRWDRFALRVLAPVGPSAPRKRWGRSDRAGGSRRVAAGRAGA